ncbi:MAG: UDP-2,4-diacetamido-2,4,6-trideoxy-beta-L-altropyranose hydrolase [Nitrospiraceae bacterium]
MRIAFRCDASPSIGGGHVMRCISLACALGERGHEVTFVCTTTSKSTVKALEESHFPVLLLEDEDLSGERTTAALQGHWNQRGDIIVFDSYVLGALAETRSRRVARRVVAIDDLANRRHDCELLLDQSYGRSAETYAEFVPRRCCVLAGTRYALLRPEFAVHRKAALMRRSMKAPCQRLLVTMGLTDVGGITAKVVQAISSARTGMVIDAVVGRQATSMGSLMLIKEGNPNVNIHVDTDRLCELMTCSDLAIGGAGSTMWERCCLGLPTLALILADNQFSAARALSDAGCCISLDARGGIPPNIASVVEDLSHDNAGRHEMALRASDVCDGLGVSRVVSCLEDL